MLSLTDGRNDEKPIKKPNQPYKPTVMKKLFTTLLLVVLGGICFAQASIPTSISIQPKEVNLLANLPEKQKILSINNSLIAYNDQYLAFNNLATSAGRIATWTPQTRLGKTLRYHYEEGDNMTSDGPSAKLMIRSQAWTHIILQEQSEKPLTNPTDFRASVLLWKNYIKDYCPNPYAKIIMAMNWPFIGDTDFSGATTTLYNTYMDIAKELGISICPIGNAYNAIRQTEGESAKNSLYTDDRHPTVLATYLASCLEYASLFNESPAGLNYRPSEISAAEATKMQQYAWNTYQAHNDIANDATGTVKFSYAVLDQFNQPMTGVPLTWNVNSGGTISNGVFTKTSNSPAALTVTVQSATLSNTATINIVNPIVATEDEDYAIIGPTTAYSQNFDAIGVEATATLPTGWKIEKRTDAPRTLGTYTGAVTQTENVGGNNLGSANGLYNFGAGTAASATDRAIGGLSTSVAGGARGVNMYLKIKNTGATAIQALNISYDVEKYRNGSNAAGFIMQLYYSTDGQTWTSAGNNFLTTFGVDANSNGYASAPGETRPVSASLQQPLLAGAYLYLAWNYSVASGTAAANAQALGIDNVIITNIIDYAQVTTTTNYTQGFDAIGTTATADLPLGWRIEKRIDAPRTLGTYNRTVTQTEYAGGNNLGSSNGLYNFGAGDAASATDRAIGGLSTSVGGGTRGINMYLKIKNTGAAAIDALNISYDVEKYRKGSNAEGFIMQLYYSTDGQTWTSAGNSFLTKFDADDETIGYDNAPGDSKNVNATLQQPLAAGADLYLAWNYSVASGTTASNAQALGIDNIEIKNNTALPLKFTSFSAKLNGLGNKQVALIWTTEQEINTDYFEIERAGNNSQFEAVGTTPSNNSIGTHSYTFTHTQPLSGISYYRIKQIDKDGKYSYSETRSVNNNGLALSIYPNPATHTISFVIPQSLEDGKMTIYSATGQKVFTKNNVTSSDKIDISKFGTGFYFIEISKQNHKETVKFLKQ